MRTYIRIHSSLFSPLFISFPDTLVYVIVSTVPVANTYIFIKC